MCQSLQNNTPPTMGRSHSNRFPTCHWEEAEVLNGMYVFHWCSFQGDPEQDQGNRGVSSSLYLCGGRVVSRRHQDGRKKAATAEARTWVCGGSREAVIWQQDVSNINGGSTNLACLGRSSNTSATETSRRQQQPQCRRKIDFGGSRGNRTAAKSMATRHQK